ncbi:sugar transferase [Novosphingobium aromaticivorans DSM 12444]|uniref:Sugar transferase n=1 Tax=Novosphingobium aromaticivorans (strain ATCC 700278 / DSM 12444 / CCUG 56034 / CIP 105152 / NBRC 16084 / F199) TaxID=279238 RepID=Q2G3C0_NOVAD|nr:sugar transferase [Novosphingobium aromaticivorans]ABD27653.1 sugar transferase [Novosphingobium aromaticivorans DSM 12444]SCY31371.1 Sugar transferase involved in LPS biosynthesis (colanic, teichoic acid) [Novosphingobium aromaticivorans]
MTRHMPISETQDAPPRRRITLPLAPPLEQRRLQLYIALLLLDGAAILNGFCIASWLYLGRFLDETSLLHSQVMLPIYWSIALSLQVYTLTALRRPNFARARAGLSLIGAETVLLFVGFATKSTDNFSRVSSLLGLGLSLVLLMWVRALVRPLIKARCGDAVTNTLLIDDGGTPLRIPHAYHIDAREHHLAPDLSDPHMMDRLGLYMMNMDRVMVSCPHDRRAAWALVFKSANVSGEIVDPEVNMLGVLGARRERGYGALIVASGPLGLRARAVKRLLDLALAGGAVLALGPVLLLVAVLIKLEDGGPVLFIQKRTGRGNRFFPIFKFRSMRVERLDSTGSRSASKDDDRITRIGRFIRSTSIDELPQLFNVLRGEMSIVGPRPHAIGSLAGEKLFWEVDHRYWLRHSLKPGLTGLAQVRGLRGATDTETDLANRLQADLEYLDGWTIWRDLKIIVNTARVLVHDRAF